MKGQFSSERKPNGTLAMRIASEEQIETATAQEVSNLVAISTCVEVDRKGPGLA